jgi:peptidoglycan DL-endopeptidase LytF
MNTPSPLIPQGTFLEKKGKSHIRIAVFTILAIHVVLLGALLLQGCKRNNDTANKASEPTNTFSQWTPPPLPPLETITNTDTAPPPLPPFSETTTTSAPPPVPPVPAPIDNIPIPPPRPEAALPTGPTTTSPSGQEYVILKGDTFYLLAKKFRVSQQSIANANPTVDPRRLQVGQKIYIPAPAPSSSSSTSGESGTATAPGNQKTYNVKSGDNLTRIARRYGTTPRALREANSLTSDRIVVGQKLVIPSGNGKPQ